MQAESHTWIFVELSQKGLGSLVPPNLGKLKGNGSSTVRGVHTHVLGILDDLCHSTLRLSCWLAVCDNDHQDGFLQIPGLDSSHEEGLNDLLVKVCAQGCHPIEIHL